MTEQDLNLLDNFSHLQSKVSNSLLIQLIHSLGVTFFLTSHTDGAKRESGPYNSPFDQNVLNVLFGITTLES